MTRHVPATPSEWRPQQSTVEPVLTVCVGFPLRWCAAPHQPVWTRSCWGPQPAAWGAPHTRLCTAPVGKYHQLKTMNYWLNTPSSCRKVSSIKNNELLTQHTQHCTAPVGKYHQLKTMTYWLNTPNFVQLL